MKTKYRFNIYGNITKRHFAKTVTLEHARHLARFFIEKEIRIVGEDVDEVVESNPVCALQTCEAEPPPHID